MSDPDLPGADLNAHAERFVKLYAKAARAMLGWSGVEAQLFIKLVCGYGIDAKSLELKATDLDKEHVADLKEEANKHRRLLSMKKQGSPQDTLPLPCRMRHAVHVCRCLEQWQQPPTPLVPGKPKHGKPGPSSSKSQGPVAAPGAAAAALTRIGKALAETQEFVFDPAAQIGVGIDPGVTQAVSVASGVWDEKSGQLVTDQLARWKLTKGRSKLSRHLPGGQPEAHHCHPGHLGCGVAGVPGPQVRMAAAEAVRTQDRALEQFFMKLEKEMAELSMKRHNRAKQLVVFFRAASIGIGGGWGADAVLRACCKVVSTPRGTDQRRGRVVLVDKHRTSRVSSAVNGQQPCDSRLMKRSATRPAGWKPPAGQVHHRLVRPA
ncbi:hypothetical protein QJQ45_011490 [Haematococcus lacustris]|nr:hypothetical protein QJQ45_011490 [Haematococcus lacustris]